MKFKLCVLGLAFMVASCGSAQPPDANPSSQTTGSTTEQAAPVSEALLISGDGIGPARLGMTLGDLKQELGDRVEFSEEIPLMVDFNAIAISQNGEEQYYIVYGTWETMTDSDPIQMLLTKNSKYQTREGVGPGMAIAQAESAYGDAMLNHNMDNEGREYIQFANPPFEHISFRTNGSPGNFAGIYGENNRDSQDPSYYETQEFRNDATISMVMVDGNVRQRQTTGSGSTLLTSSSSNAQAQDINCENPRGTPEFNYCSEQEYQDADRQLNQTYQQLTATLDRESREQLTDAQLAWIKLRDTRCEAVSAASVGGTGFATYLNTCLSYMTWQRTSQLEDALGPDGLLRTADTLGVELGVVTVDGQQIDCANPQGTPSINYCAGMAYQEVDRQLNQVYQRLRASLPSRDRELLTDTQLAWIDFRDTHCEFAVREAMGGTGYSSYLHGCLATVTQNRINELDDSGSILPF